VAKLLRRERSGADNPHSSDFAEAAHAVIAAAQPH